MVVASVAFVTTTASYVSGRPGLLTVELAIVAIVFAILSVTAPWETTPGIALVPQSFGALSWAYFLAAGSTTELLFPLSVVWIPVLALFEWRRAKRYGFLPGAPVRVAVVLAALFLAARAPTKWLDRHFVAFRTTYPTLREVEAQGRAHGLEFPYEFRDQRIHLPARDVSLRLLLSAIEQQTALKPAIGWCGTGESILYGMHPIGAIRFRGPNSPPAFPPPTSVLR